MSVVNLVRGTILVIDQTVTATGGATVPDWSVTDLTFILDGPNNARFEFKWRPSGTSSPYLTYNAGTNVLTLTLDSTWTYTNLTRGAWSFQPLFQTPSTNQLYIGTLQINVDDLANGRPPVVS